MESSEPTMQEMLSRVQLSSSEEQRIRENLKSCWPQLPAGAGAGMVEMFRLGVASLMDERDQKSRSINMARLKQRLDKAREEPPQAVPQGLTCDTNVRRSLSLSPPNTTTSLGTPLTSPLACG